MNLANSAKSVDFKSVMEKTDVSKDNSKFIALCIAAYFGFVLWSVWSNWLLIPFFLIIPCKVYKFITGIVYLLAFRSSPSFLTIMFMECGATKEDILTWLVACEKELMCGNYFATLEFVYNVYTGLTSGTKEEESMGEKIAQFARRREVHPHDD